MFPVDFRHHQPCFKYSSVRANLSVHCGKISRDGRGGGAVTSNAK